MRTLPIAAMLTPAPGQSGGLGSVMFIVQIAAFVAIFWFLLIRPQRQQAKKHEELLKQLKKGDEVVTSGGIVGEILHIKDDRVTIRSAESKLVVLRKQVADVIASKPEEKAPA